MTKKLIIANWKMNPQTLTEAIRLAKKIETGTDKIRGVEIVIAPPFPFILPVAATLRKSKIGAQNIFWEEKGAQTGEVSPIMLKNLCVSYCIIGHSERRALGETDEMVNKKIKAALKNKIIPVLAVGEKKRMSYSKTRRAIETQLKKDLKGISKNEFKNGVIAYEPVWAIGTGLAANPEHAQKALIIIKEALRRLWKTKNVKTRILYGGSVNAQNAWSFISKNDGGMDGMLVGGASLNAKEFIGIVRSTLKSK